MKEAGHALVGITMPTPQPDLQNAAGMLDEIEALGVD
jgi:hypothetical protein